MKLNKRLGLVVLSIWLILIGLTSFGVGFAGLDVILAILAIIAGALLLLGQ